VTLAVTGNTISGRLFSVSEGAGVQMASITVDLKSMGQKVADRSSNEPDFLCNFLYLAWRLWKSVVTLVFTVITFSGWVFQNLRLPVFQWHRPSLTASRWDIRWLIGRRTKPTFCVFLYLTWRLWKSVVTLVVTRNTICGRVFRRHWVPEFERH
jgi:hypothetical protein